MRFLRDASERTFTWLYGLIVGTAAFVYVTGGAIINPTNRDWLMRSCLARH